MVANADPAALNRLLDLQVEDSAIRQLQHRRETLPEAQELAAVNDRLAELASDLEIATKQFEEAEREQSRLEGEISLIDDKISREDKRMLSGGVSSPKELSALQAEVESLRRKKSGIEDQLLEVMEQREQAETTLRSIRDEHEAITKRSAELGDVVNRAIQDIDADLSLHGQQRDAIAPEIPADLVTLYDRLRAEKAGIGAAALRSGTCEGCHTQLPAKEVERLRSEGGLQRCDNCRRILVIV
jgi:uncharacterized protein